MPQGRFPPLFPNVTKPLPKFWKTLRKWRKTAKIAVDASHFREYNKDGIVSNKLTTILRRRNADIRMNTEGIRS